MDEAERDCAVAAGRRAAGRHAGVRLDEEDAGRFLTGLRRRIDAADAAAVRVYGPQPRAFLGSAHITAGELIADRLLSPAKCRHSSQQS